MYLAAGSVGFTNPRRMQLEWRADSTPTMLDVQSCRATRNLCGRLGLIEDADGMVNGERKRGERRKRKLGAHTSFLDAPISLPMENCSEAAQPPKGTAELEQEIRKLDRAEAAAVLLTDVETDPPVSVANPFTMAGCIDANVGTHR
jgi:hypothetical protein